MLHTASGLQNGLKRRSDSESGPKIGSIRHLPSMVTDSVKSSELKSSELKSSELKSSELDVCLIWYPLDRL